MTETEEELAAPAPKPPPRGLELRGRPRPAIRFRKSIIVGIAGLACTLIATFSWMSLRPATFARLGAEDPARPASPPEALSRAPSTYSDVPRLGPPLPGDLGRPILEQQRRMAGEEGPADEANRAAAEQHRQDLAEARAALGSAVFVRLAAAETKRAAEPITPGTGAAGAFAAGADAPAARPRNETSPEKLERSSGAPSSTFMLAAGTIIRASLLTGLNSELPGIVIAQVTDNVRDSATGQAVLVPRGARLIGRYESRISYGQKRALVSWTKLVFPDGSSLGLGNMPGADTAGYAGLSDRVDAHGFALLKGAAISSLLNIGSELELSGRGGIARAIRDAGQDTAGRVGAQIVARNLDVQPTLTVRPGWPVLAIVDEDLPLKPWSR